MLGSFLESATLPAAFVGVSPAEFPHFYPLVNTQIMQLMIRCV
jgi:hypothetical protein